VAIFHLSSNKIAKPFTAFARLTHLVDFNSIDSQPVDMVFLLMSPAYDGPLHLRRLSRITRRFKNEKFRESLRGASDSELLYALWNDPEYLPQAA
jgi:PTS system nitrogen regulatory IIA component